MSISRAIDSEMEARALRNRAREAVYRLREQEGSLSCDPNPHNLRRECIVALDEYDTRNQHFRGIASPDSRHGLTLDVWVWIAERLV